MTLFVVVVVEGEIQRIEHCRYKREGDFEQESENLNERARVRARERESESPSERA